MNILFLSYLHGGKWSGPTYSVPRQAEAHSRLDNVFWYNIRKPEVAEWKALPYYHDVEEYPEQRIAALPAPFDKPDLVIAEQFYGYADSPLRAELSKGDIPYIIIPRGELTAEAQSFKKAKKTIANLLMFNRFAKNALAIEYLTEREKEESGDRWNSKAIVVPNGSVMPQNTKTGFSKEGIKCISIGRLDSYHKGLDLLVDACGICKNALIENKVSVGIYGPDVFGQKQELLDRIRELRLEKLITVGDGLFDLEKEYALLDSDVFLLPSRFEGHPMALIEALSYGLPCIAGEGSNMRKEVENHKAGWTCDNTAESLAEALLALIKEKETLPEKGKNALRLARNYDWDTIARTARAEYDMLLKNDRHGK